MDWIDRFPGLRSLDDSLRKVLLERSTIVSLAKNTVVFGPGKSSENLLLLLDGTVRVQQLSESGREIVMYRVQAGESCVLSTACMLAYEDHSAEGIAEVDVRAAAIPRQVFDDLIANSQTFRTFVFTAYSRRITDLFYVIEEIAFRRIDIRLAARLGELADGQGILRATHAQLASELGTAREVISRQLQEFQRKGWVELSRGSVKMTDQGALAALAETT
ncbi:Crp/Fnr family transcriptional regulator [Candidatus Halocynthiibacter alkanivorans]|uniref:Crp/Fnr family transcriptional regulator n=1 Tax=Candidatus Halocynthiibacter alkanivorans TaxID=2267619 RepID=UPI001F1AE88F|nr:Crp/Fnr family transcriptional regulator [Candidatus Halocynthiibacter alkanivorans]